MEMLKKGLSTVVLSVSTFHTPILSLLLLPSIPIPTAQDDFFELFGYGVAHFSLLLKELQDAKIANFLMLVDSANFEKYHQTIVICCSSAPLKRPAHKLS